MTAKEELFRLPLEERLELVQHLWDSIAAESAQIELTEAQKQELDRRLQKLEDSMRTLAEIEAAAASLAPEEKEELLRFLAMSLRKERPCPRPRIYSQQELAAILEEDERDGQQLSRGN